MATQYFATLSASTLADDLRVLEARGSEAICRPYRFDLHFVVAGATPIDLAEAVGSRATLQLARDDDTPATYHGILASIEMRVQTAEFALYHAVLVPALWRLGLTRHSRLFTKKKLPDVIKEVLESGGLASDDFELKLDASYGEEEHIVQYRESKLDFLHRWMEHEGIYYYFDHSGDAREKLVIVDHRSLHDKLVDKQIRYFPLADRDRSAGECFDTFAVMHNVVTAKVRVSDYDYSRPLLDVSAQADVSDQGFGEVVEHDARLWDPTEARRYATLRAEELRAREVTFHFGGNALHASAGYLLDIVEHPTDAYNTSYLAVEVQHFVNELGGEAAEGPLRRFLRPAYEEIYRTEVKAIDAAVQYRPPRITPKPRVWGHVGGVVDGPANSQYAQIDDQGRYHVKFSFDESDLSDGVASTYVRMMQPHGGENEGFHFPLRKGTEVVFTFLDGDPDRPVIAGAVPNMTRPSLVTEKNYTQNVVRTGGGNLLRIDDTEGKQFIHLFTPKLTDMFMGGPSDACGEWVQSLTFVEPPTTKAGGPATREVATTFYLYTDGTAGFLVDGEWWQTVGNSMYVDVDGDFTEHYTGFHTLNIDANSAQYYNAFLKVEVHDNEDRTVEGWWNLTANTGATITTPKLHQFATTEFLLETPKATMKATGTAELQFGQTTLRFGPTEMHWGATTGDIASLTLDIPGGATINTPSWEVNNPTNFWHSAFHEISWGSKISIAAQDISAAGIKSENAGIELQWVGMESEQTAAKLKQIGATLGQIASILKNGGIDIDFTGMKLW